ncbi:MAG: catechol 1,2-dioxygenase [Cyclobacteriaceae bacterium]
MKRRDFAKLTGLGAMAVYTTGFVNFNGRFYEGDCQTTTDILGPFYRPNSPVRNNLVIKDMPGDVVELSGVVRQRDCITPQKGAKVELWHCSADQVYDNDSDEFLYRGTTFCDNHGKYSFLTQMPVPYEVGGGIYRPAHFHLMISAPGYQNLITQIYFTGDPYLDKDSSSAAAEAKSRILNFSESGGRKGLLFDVNMGKKLGASFAALKQLVGKYKDDKSGRIIELFHSEGLLWMKNEVYGKCYEYIGDNTFTFPGTSTGTYEKLKFDLKGAEAKLTLKTKGNASGERIRTFTKI